ncbi:hypothetical protein DL95DRAFT_400323 [Leptodontidium sp. 2 PMI_412]|nr:hypothetical protein DL95DRAFT_400323 [Leptodontidium sp. 2 PMI_412]
MDQTRMPSKAQKIRKSSSGGSDIAGSLYSQNQFQVLYKVLSHYRVTEKWFRRIVTATQKIPYSRPCWIFAACLEVIQYLRNKRAEFRHELGPEGIAHDETEILRDLLSRSGASMSTDRTFRIMQELAEILDETDHLEEAISRFEKEFVLILGKIPLLESLMKTNCRNLRLCYARLERYEEAMLHFRHMIERLTIDDPQCTDARLEFIHEVND